MLNYLRTPFMKNRKYFFFLMIPLVFCLLTLVMMLLWNALLPGLLSVHAINYWQALGLMVLCRILFGGFSFGGKPPFGGPPHRREKWMNMSEEERIKFKEAWRKRFEERK